MGCRCLNLNPIHCIARNPWSCIVGWLFFGVSHDPSSLIFHVATYAVDCNVVLIRPLSISFLTTKFFFQTLLLCTLLASPSVSHGWPNFGLCPRSHQHWMLSNFHPSGHRQGGGRMWKRDQHLLFFFQSPAWPPPPPTFLIKYVFPTHVFRNVFFFGFTCNK